MDDAEGFFPERRLLAYRRSLLKADPATTSTTSQSGAGWWIPFVCIWPSFFSIWVSGARHAPEHVPVPIVVFGGYVLAACLLIFAVLGIVVGMYRGLRSQRSPALK